MRWPPDRTAPSFSPPASRTMLSLRGLVAERDALGGAGAAEGGVDDVAAGLQLETGGAALAGGDQRQFSVRRRIRLENAPDQAAVNGGAVFRQHCGEAQPAQRLNRLIAGIDRGERHQGQIGFGRILRQRRARTEAPQRANPNFQSQKPHAGLTPHEIPRA